MISISSKILTEEVVNRFSPKKKKRKLLKFLRFVAQHENLWC